MSLEDNWFNQKFSFLFDVKWVSHGLIMMSLDESWLIQEFSNDYDIKVCFVDSLRKPDTSREKILMDGYFLIMICR